MKAIAVLAGLLVAAGQGGPKDDLDRLQGDWVCVSMERDGKPIDPDRYKGGVLTMDGDRFTFKVGDRIVSQGIRKLDPSKMPKAVDDTHTIGLFKGRTYKGIYKIEGDTFTTCNGSAGQDRPTEFVSRPGSSLLLVVYRRAKRQP
jgi:uncharacterized protein (TIGR03067 family)